MALKTEFDLDISKFKANLDILLSESKKAGEQIAKSFSDANAKGIAPKLDTSQVGKLVDSYKAAKTQSIAFLESQKEIQTAMRYAGLTGTDAYQDIEKSIKEAQLELKKFDDITDKSSSNTTDKTSKMSSAFGGIMSGLSLGGGIAIAQKGLELVGTGINELWEQSKRADEISTNMEIGFRNAGLSGEELSKQIEKSEIAARKLGFSIGVAPERLKELAALSGTLGGATGKMNDDMVKAAIGIEKATNGMINGEGAIRLFSKGISDPENEAALNKLKSQFPALAAELLKVTDPAKKVTGALDFLGGTFTALENDMSDADAKMQNFKNIASEMAQGFGGNILAAFDINSILDMFGKTDIEALLSDLKNAGTQIGEFLTGAVKTLITYVQGAWEYFSRAFVEPLKSLGSEFAKLFEPIGELINEVFGGGGESIVTFSDIMKGLGNVVGFLINTALVPLKFAFQGIGLIIEGVTAYVKLVKANFNQFTETIKDTYNNSAIFKSIVDGIASAFKEVSKFVGFVIDGIVEFYDRLNGKQKKAPFKETKKSADEATKSVEKLNNAIDKPPTNDKDLNVDKKKTAKDDADKKRQETEKSITEFLKSQLELRTQNELDYEKNKQQLLIDSYKKELDLVKANNEISLTERSRLANELQNKIINAEFQSKRDLLQETFSKEATLIIENSKKQLELQYTTAEQRAKINALTSDILEQQERKFLDGVTKLENDANLLRSKNQKEFVRNFVNSFTLIPKELQFSGIKIEVSQTSLDTVKSVASLFKDSFDGVFKKTTFEKVNQGLDEQSEKLSSELESQTLSYATFVGKMEDLNNQRVESDNETTLNLIGNYLAFTGALSTALVSSLSEYEKYITDKNKIDAERLELERQFNDDSIKDAERKAQILQDIDKLNAESKNAEVDVYRNAATQLKAIFEEQTLAYKATAIAEASIATYLAATKALTLPFPLGEILAGILIASGLANVAKIAGFEKGGYTGNKGTKEVAGLVHGQEYVVNAKKYRENKGLIDAMEKNKIGDYVVTEYGHLLKNVNTSKLNYNTKNKDLGNVKLADTVEKLSKKIDNLTIKTDTKLDMKFDNVTKISGSDIDIVTKRATRKQLSRF